jgi:ribose transport system permease protein
MRHLASFFYARFFRTSTFAHFRAVGSSVTFSEIGLSIRFLLEHNLILANAILLGVMLVIFPGPMSSQEARLSFLSSATMLGLLTFGQAIVLMSGGIDLSNGALIGLTSILAAWIALNFGLSYILIGTLAVGVLIGSINGFLVTKTHFPSLIATLVSLGISTGLAVSITGGAPITLRNNSMVWLGRASFGGLPYYSFFWIALIPGMYFLLTKTRFGRHVYAVGASEKAAYVCGVNTDRVKFLVYVNSALLAWVGGIVYSCYTASGVPIAGGFKYMLDSISAAVIGGVSLSGGKGNILDTALGATFFAFLYMAVIFLKVSPLLEGAFRGTLLLIVVLYAFVREKREQ